MPRADVSVRQKPRKGHRRGFDLLKRQSDSCDGRKRDLFSEGPSYDREWGWPALRRNCCRKLLKVAGQREVKKEICPGRTKRIRNRVCFEGSLLQVVFGRSLPSEIQIPSLVLILTCADSHPSFTKTKSFHLPASYRNSSGISGGGIFLGFLQASDKYMFLTLLFLSALADRGSSLL